MKQVIKIAIAAFLLFAAPQVGAAQKIAHINRDSLIKIMPDYKIITDSLTKYELTVKQILDGMEREYEAKAMEYDSLKKAGALSQLREQLYMKQLSDMQQNYAAYGAAADEEFATIQQSLILPLFKKVDDAIAAVAKEQGYSYVLDSSKSLGVVLYAKENDIFNDVCKKLNVTPPPPKPAPKPAPGGGNAPAPAPK